MHKHEELSIKRLKSAYARNIAYLLFHENVPMTLERWDVPGEPIPYADMLEQADWRPARVGEKWGPRWGTTWFRCTGTVPKEWSGRDVRALFIVANDAGEGFTGEGLVYQDGKPTCSVSPRRKDILITRSAKGGERFEFYVEAAANRHEESQPRPVRPLEQLVLKSKPGPQGLSLPEPDGPPIFVLHEASLSWLDPLAWEVFHDWIVVYDLMVNLPEATPRRGQLLRALNDCANLFDEHGRDALQAVRDRLAPVLAAKNGSSQHELSAIGHAHIDTAWLWPLRETIRKCARTFANALTYMEEYPDYVFVCSQPVQYAWMKAHYPNIYKGIKAAIKRGQWECTGSMWVEPDCNVPSGESLVRQILHGKRFFLDEFGVETTDVWIPDVFGYSASMPQIMDKSGIHSFLTQKISWSQFNRFPHHTFLWEGIDGTQIFTHFPPANTYNAVMHPRELLKNVDEFKEHDRANRSLYVYGYGDGGGGPIRQMLEVAKRCEDLEGLPKVTLEKASDFFVKAKEDAVDLPVWVGELYLEYHRGTLTTQARTKLGNRKGELDLREAEFVDALEMLVGGGSVAEGTPITAQAPARPVYDVTECARGEERRGHAGALDRAWKLLLLNQFHDILPGSSIHWVYQDAATDYRNIEKLAHQVFRDAFANIHSHINTGEAKRPALALNTLPFPRAGIVNGEDDGQPRWVEAPACGYAVLDDANLDELPEGVAPVTLAESAAGGYLLSNGLIKVQIDENGLITRLTDLENDREVLAEGEVGNLLQIHPDYPMAYEAWDVDAYYRDVVEDIRSAESLFVAEISALRCAIQVERSFGQSTIAQRIVLKAGSRQLEFPTEVDWHERQRFLKVAFPVDVHSSRATYDIQYGYAERPTHENTMWDVAKFEVCGQTWADLSEPDYGVALLNDCKYGYDIHGNVMRLSLLRGPAYPDPEADLGKQVFRYALLPHAGGVAQARIPEAGAAFNTPVQLSRIKPNTEGNLPSARTFIDVSRPGVFVEAFKVAEDGDALILRLVERHGTRGKSKVTLNTGGTVKTIETADLLERPEHALAFVAGEDGTASLNLTFKPFEIKCLRLGF